MKEPTAEQLNKIRKQGYRPGVVACILCAEKLLIFYKNNHKIWQLPQGGIDNEETYKEALQRMVKNKLGASLLDNLDFNNIHIIEFNKMEFKPGKYEVKSLVDSSGKEIQMLGKYYFFYIINAKSLDVKIEETQFDQYFWVSFREAYFLTGKMYQKGKKRITQKAINKLQELGLIK